MGKIQAVRQTVATALDGWRNVFSNAGVKGRDPQASTTYGIAELAVAVETVFDQLYQGEGRAAKIVDLPAREMTRQWFHIEADDGEKVIDRLNEIHAKTYIRQGIKWARLHGGSIVIMHLNDGQKWDLPLNETTLRSIDGFSVYSRWRLDWDEVYSDYTKPSFQMPTRYKVTPLAITGGATIEPFVVHESRVIRMEGIPLPDRLRSQNRGWGDSVIVRCFPELKNVGMSDAYSVSIIRDFVQGVLKINNLATMLATNQSKQVVDRLNIIDMSRSILNTILVDGTGEEYSKISSTVNGLPDLLDRHREALAAVAEMPMTLLYGRPPAGLTSDDESGRRNWYDKIKGEQEEHLQSPLERLVRLVYLTKDGPTGGKEPESWNLCFNPLSQLTGVEESERRLNNAKADGEYVKMGSVTPKTVAESRFKYGRYGDDIELKPDSIPDAPPVAALPTPAPINGPNQGV